MLAWHRESPIPRTSGSRPQIYKAKLTRPVAPQHASLASSINTDLPPLTSSRAANAPVMPLPTTTMSAAAGSSCVVRCPNSVWDGSWCQYDLVLSVLGKSACSSSSVAMAMVKRDEYVLYSEASCFLIGNAEIGPICISESLVSW